MEDNHPDLISELPDALLLHIFSFLDETAIIQSSILSRRWRYLWTFVPFPEHIKNTRYCFKTQKIEIRKEKLRLEKVAENTVFKLSIDVTKFIGLYCLHALLTTMLELQIFGVIHFYLTLVSMLHIQFSCWTWKSRLTCLDEACMKRLQERDSRLTLAASSYSTRMELLFSDDYEPRYAETAKVYGLFGMVMVMIISCIVAVLRWKIEFILEGGGSKRIFFGYLSFFSFLIHLDIVYIYGGLH